MNSSDFLGSKNSQSDDNYSDFNKTLNCSINWDEELDNSEVYIYEGILAIILIIITILGLGISSYVLFVMLKTKKIRENSSNFLIIVTLTVDVLFALWFLICYVSKYYGSCLFLALVFVF